MMEICLTQSLSPRKPSLPFRSSNLFLLLNQQTSLWLWPSHKTRTQKPIICARNRKRRSGSERSRKFILESVFFIASKLNVLPEPLNLAIRDFGGGNGGGLGFWKGFGWEGFDGWRRRKRKLGFFEFVMAFGLGLWVILGKELYSDFFMGVFGLPLFEVSVNGWKRRVKDWTFGFCFCAVLVGLVLKREDLHRWAKGFRAMEIRRGRKRTAM